MVSSQPGSHVRWTPDRMRGPSRTNHRGARATAPLRSLRLPDGGPGRCPPSLPRGPTASSLQTDDTGQPSPASVRDCVLWPRGKGFANSRAPKHCCLYHSSWAPPLNSTWPKQNCLSRIAGEGSVRSLSWPVAGAPSRCTSSTAGSLPYFRLSSVCPVV